ncbi:MAG: tetratricopeptide repeat protein [Pseudomonadota bacterium]
MTSPVVAAAQQLVAVDINTQRTAADAGDSAAQFDMGNRYLVGDGVIADEYEAARWFRKAADQDNNNAQYNLGVMYMQGTGVIADLNEAINWFRRAAELGDPPAQFTMATLYANGKGVPQDPVQAHLWFTLAASSGDRAAAANLVLYQEMMSNEQVAESQRLAAEWIEKFNSQRAAAEADDDTAARLP